MEFLHESPEIGLDLFFIKILLISMIIIFGIIFAFLLYLLDRYSIGYSQETDVTSKANAADKAEEKLETDFCKWIKIKSNEYIILTHAGSYNSSVLDRCVCPYCGKLIKIMEEN